MGRPGFRVLKQGRPSLSIALREARKTCHEGVNVIGSAPWWKVACLRWP